MTATPTDRLEALRERVRAGLREIDNVTGLVEKHQYARERVEKELMEAIADHYRPIIRAAQSQAVLEQTELFKEVVDRERHEYHGGEFKIGCPLCNEERVELRGAL